MRQLREDVRSLLGLASSATNHPYNISQMHVGTIPPLCQRPMMDRRFYPKRRRSHPPVLLNELDRYFHLYRPATWKHLDELASFDSDASQAINASFGDESSSSRHRAVSNAFALFKRWSKECLAPLSTDPVLTKLIQMYTAHLASLRPPSQPAARAPHMPGVGGDSARSSYQEQGSGAGGQAGRSSAARPDVCLGQPA